MRKGYLAAGVLAATLLISSCSTPKDVAYFQDITTGTVITPAQVMDIKVRPEDKLSITVSTQDPALSSLFNLVTTDNRITTTTSTTSQVGNATSSNSRASFYTVNSKGDIHFPVLGEIHVAGMTREQVAKFIEQRLRESDLVKDPIVVVEFANTGISVLGEVNDPGRYEFNVDRLNILEAISMAGDLAPNGQRQNILVMRLEPDGSRTSYRVDITDMQSLASSPVYYMQQNDVIYVEPNDKKKRETTPNGNSPFTPSFWLSVGSFAVTVATLIITITR